MELHYPESLGEKKNLNTISNNWIIRENMINNCVVGHHRKLENA